MSDKLEKLLIAWCEEYIKSGERPGKKHHENGKYIYYDCTGASGYDSGFDISLMNDGTYRVGYCDSYTDIPDDQYPQRYITFNNIREALMFAAFHGFDSSATQTCILQMMLNGIDIGYTGNREEVKDLHDIKWINLDKENESFVFVPKYDKDYLIKTLEIPIELEKCSEQENYLFPDLTKIDDTDTEFLKMIAKQVKDKMKYNIRT